MGSAQSDRRVTIVNDVVGVVQVSENVVRRLKGMPEKSTEFIKESPEKESELPSEPQPSSRYVPFVEPFSSTLEQRQKYHEEFRKAEKSWNNRIMELEAQNRQLFDATKENFANMLYEVETNHVKNSYSPVCPDKQQQVLKCYKENVKLPLNCSREVKDFMDCVDKIRMTAISK